MDCVFDITGRSDEFTKAMVISALNARRGSHHSIITTAAPGSKRKGENSREKVQNVVTDSTADFQRFTVTRCRFEIGNSRCSFVKHKIHDSDDRN